MKVRMLPSTAFIGVVLIVAGCGSPPPSADRPSSAPSTLDAESSQSASGAGTPTSDYKACLVTDIGGIDDKGFNASSWAGMQAAQDAGAATVSYVTSKASADYVPNIANLVSQNCELILTAGGLIAQAALDSAKAHPDQKYVLIDAPGNNSNAEGIQFNSAQSSFLGGYLAASQTKTGKIATYGGLDIPPVTAYMDGFWEGVQYFNKMKGKNVELLGWDEKTQEGVFAGAFNDQTKGQQLATNFAQQGADIIYPVAGATGLGTAAAAQASGGRYSVVWVDVDGCTAAPQYCSIFLSTVYRDVAKAVQTVVTEHSAGNSNPQGYIGTLANGLTGLAPFHDFDTKVDQATKDELKAITADIVSGKIAITSPNQPK